MVADEIGLRVAVGIEVADRPERRPAGGVTADFDGRIDFAHGGGGFVVHFPE
ncbi:hypothetical protein SDC9_195013 [bioreactor metagenome]|uniref:Uncharacterized protein n=1 Tax=bioreactor metagenome TaxID=1076179 RepID=A0A645I7V9_9ZZZZ